MRTSSGLDLGWMLTWDTAGSAAPLQPLYMRGGQRQTQKWATWPEGEGWLHSTDGSDLSHSKKKIIIKRL